MFHITNMSHTIWFELHREMNLKCMYVDNVRLKDVVFMFLYTVNLKSLGWFVWFNNATFPLKESQAAYNRVV